MVRNKAKEIPLHYAAGDEDANYKIVQSLLKSAPESILMKDKKGRTPFDLAKDSEVHVEVYELLRTYYKQQYQHDSPSAAETSKKAQPTSKKKKKKEIDLNDSVGSMNLNDVLGEPDGSHTALDRSVGSKSNKKKMRQKEGMAASVSFPLNESMYGSMDLSRKKNGPAHGKKKKKLEGVSQESVNLQPMSGSLHGSMDLNDIHEKLDSSHGALQHDSKSSSGKSKKKKKKTDAHLSGDSIALSIDEEIGSSKKKRMSSKKSAAESSKSSTAAKKKGKGLFEKRTKKSNGGESGDGGGPTTPSEKKSKSKKSSANMEMADLVPLETPKQRKDKVSSDKSHGKNPKTPKPPKKLKTLSEETMDKTPKTPKKQKTSTELEHKTPKQTKTPKTKTSKTPKSTDHKKRKKSASGSPALPDLR